MPPTCLADQGTRRPLPGQAPDWLATTHKGHGWALAHLERSWSAHNATGSQPRQRPARRRMAPDMRDLMTWGPTR